MCVCVCVCVCCRVYTKAERSIVSGCPPTTNLKNGFCEFDEHVTGTVPVSSKLSCQSSAPLSDEDDVVEVQTTKLDANATFVELTVVDWTPRNVTLFL